MPQPRLSRKFILTLSTLSALLAFAVSGAHAIDSVTRVQNLVDDGQYTRAQAEIQQLLEEPQPKATRAQLLFEAERMRRILMEFTLREEDLVDSIRRYIPDVGTDDIAAWKRDNLLEYKVIDKEQLYFRKAGYNLVHISDAAAARSNDYQRFTAKAPLYDLHPHHEEITTADAPVHRRIRVDYRISVNPDAVPAGETIRAWLPFPKALPGRQENIELLGYAPAQYRLAPNEQAQRTIYFERQAEPGKPTEFSVTYEFDSIATHTAIDPSEVHSAIAPADAIAPYLQERAPHIHFTPALHALSQQIVGSEKNPYRIAQKLFAYVDSIPWAGAREYSTIRNISQYAAEAGHADCGQQTLLLITLLRMNGIPARWQSGWEFSPESFDTMHDWGEFYLAPYGWMPMDVTHGKLGGNDETLNWFYLGGLDAYRLIFNTDYSQPFVPAKQHFRSETVDSQRGEVEWRGGNLYFDQWDYQLDWQVINKN